MRSVATIADLDAAERLDLATVLRDVAIRFDNLWRMPFPYVMALHQAPIREDATDSTSTSSSIRRCGARICSSISRAGDWRWQLPERHVARRKGRRARRGGRAALPGRRSVTPDHPLLAGVQALHRRIRRDLVEACEQAAVAALSRVAREDQGDTIYEIDRGARARTRRGDRPDDCDAGCARPADRGRADGRKS